MVLNGVISASLQGFSDISPFIAYSSVVKVEDPFFFGAPLNLLDHGVQMIVPSFPALLSDSSWQVFSNLSPFLWTMSLN
jgi:hypothetical protein